MELNYRRHYRATTENETDEKKKKIQSRTHDLRDDVFIAQILFTVRSIGRHYTYIFTHKSKVQNQTETLAAASAANKQNI